MLTNVVFVRLVPCQFVTARIEDARFADSANVLYCLFPSLAIRASNSFTNVSDAARAFWKIYGSLRPEHAVFVDEGNVLLAVHGEVYWDRCVTYLEVRHWPQTAQTDPDKKWPQITQMSTDTHRTEALKRGVNTLV